MRHALLPALLISLTSLASCTSLTPAETRALDAARARDLPVPDREYVSPVTAGALNLLPGIGSMYIGAKTQEKEHWLYGVGNLLFWPLSILWAVPEAAVDAATINEKYTAWRYMEEGT